jgi:hypothetical protein
MNLIFKDWTAHIDRTPGNASFRTLGSVTVANSGVTPVLVLSDIQDKSFDLRLELKLEQSEGIALPVLTDKLVEYKVLGESNVTGVSIFFEGKLVHHVDDVLISQ